MKSTLTRMAGLAVLAAGLAALSGPAQDDAPKKKRGIKGGYTIVGGEQGGKPIPNEKWEGSKVQITDDTMAVLDAKDQKVYIAKYTLDTSKTPWALEMEATAPKEAAGTKASGLVKREKGTVTMIYNLPGGKAPDDFKTEEKQNLFVLKNEKMKKSE